MIQIDPSDSYYDPLVAQAVRNQPQAEPPPDLLLAIMQQIQQPAPKPRFSIAWYEIALGIFLAMMAGSFFLITWLLTRDLTPQEVQWAVDKMLSPDPHLFLPLVFIGIILAAAFGLFVLVFSLRELLRKPDFIGH